MTVTLSLFGAFRDLAPAGQVTLQLPADATVADLRAALDGHARDHWPGYRPELLRVSAFASSREVLRDAELLPDDGQLAVLPPVSGG
jgi:sulfur-carrier protein